MRLDKFLSVTGKATRTEAKKAIRARSVSVNGVAAISADMHINPEIDEIRFLGEIIVYRKYTYIMINKPQGVVSATEDGRDKTVLDLLPPNIKKDKLFPCGRLDKDTLGLVIITDDGELAHELLSPRSHVSKMYKFEAAEPISQESLHILENGVSLADGYITKPARVVLDEGSGSGIIVLTEGKYHQIKRMLGAINNKIVFLERISFGPVILDTALSRGEWRYLTEEEIKLLREHKKKLAE